MLRVEGVDTFYGDIQILRGISIEVGEREIIGLLGRNGRGKTTLIRAIMGTVPPRQGRIFFKDEEITKRKPYEVSRMGIGVVPQGRQIFPSLNVEENLTVVARGGAEGWTLEKIYTLFPPLKQRKSHPGNKLSGGEQQMLAIGRSLMTNPSLLLMDEPTAGLSPLYVQMLGQTIQGLKQNGISILLIEQQVGFVLRNVDYVHIMERGTIVHSSLPQDLETKQEITMKYLGI